MVNSSLRQNNILEDKNNIILFKNNKFITTNNPIILFIEGDGVGPDIMKTTIKVINSACEIAYDKKRQITWKEVYAGEKAKQKYNTYLPDKTLDKIKKYRIALKGPLTTPIGGGFRSLNVSLRQKLDLFACVRPVKYISGISSPLKDPKLDIVIFRENTEDVYAGIEFEQDSIEAKEIINFLNSKLNTKLKQQTSIGIKPISESATKRLMRSAIQYAIDNNRKKITIMHKGNIMKFTEGAFMKWCYETAKKEFSDTTILESNIIESENSKQNINNKIIINDRIADSMFQQILLRPKEYNLIITTNLNGDYISDAAAAQVGGLGISPGANINSECGLAIFEATHGSAPKYTNLDKVNPSSLILSAVMMLETIKWNKAADLIKTALQKTITQKKVTYDLARQINNTQELKCSEFGNEIIKNIK